MEGLESYEGVLREGIRVELTGTLFRRNRPLFAQERAGRIRWHREEAHVVQWESAERIAPGDSGPEELARSLLRSGAPPPLLLDRGTDRLLFGPSEWALHPLADTASLHYRYHWGDTVRIFLPDQEEPVEVVEVRVEPFENSFRRVSGSLWFEPERGILVRAQYRPAQPFRLRRDLEETNREARGFVPPIEFDIRSVSLDQSYFDFQWWVPRRYRFEGEMRAPGGLRVPVVFEWSVSELRVNEDPSPELLRGADLAAGWTSREVDRGPDRPPLIVRVSPPDSLAAASGGRPFDPWRLGIEGGFSKEELKDIEAQLRNLPPTLFRLQPRLEWGLRPDLTRFNRVEGFSTGVQLFLPLPRDREFQAEGRMGSGDRSPRGEVALEWGRMNHRRRAALFWRLDSSSEWADGHTGSASLGTLLFRNRWTPFHTSGGGEIRFLREAVGSQGELRVFAERQGRAPHTSEFHLWKGGGRPAPPANLEASPGTWTGGSLTLQGVLPGDSRWARISSRGRLEAATGTSSYARGWGSAALAVSLPGPFDVGVEGGGGGLLGTTPLQRHFLPGDEQIFRHTRPGEWVGDRFAFQRAEVRVGGREVRAVTFLDRLHLRPPQGELEPPSPWDPPRWAWGGGLSLLDGMIRADLSRRLRTSDSTAPGWQEGWRFFLYLDGLF